MHTFIGYTCLLKKETKKKQTEKDLWNWSSRKKETLHAVLISRFQFEKSIILIHTPSTWNIYWLRREKWINMLGGDRFIMLKSLNSIWGNKHFSSGFNKCIEYTSKVSIFWDNDIFKFIWTNVKNIFFWIQWGHTKSKTDI